MKIYWNDQTNLYCRINKLKIGLQRLYNFYQKEKNNNAK